MRHVLATLICLFFLGCHPSTRVNECLLAQADSLMDSRPDSALAILRKISSPQKLHGKAQADYALLLTQAEYKNYLPFTSDSLLTIAITYYQAADDKASLGKAYYYQGCFYNEQKNYLRAAECYKHAETLLQQTGDNLMLALLYNAMGHLNRKNDLKEDALQHFKQALRYSERSDQVYHIAMNLQEIATTYLVKNMPDSAGIYFARVTPYLSLCQEPKMATLFHNIGIYNADYGNLDLAERYVLKSLELEKDTSNRIGSYYALARIYRKQKRVSASDSLWNIVLNEAKDINRKKGIYGRLFEQCIAEKKYEKAISYAQKRMSCMDSIYRSSISKDVAEIQAKYDNEVLRRKNAEQQTQNMILWICIIGVSFTGTGMTYLIIYSHKKYKAKKEREISSLIARYQEELEVLEGKRSETKEESEKLASQIKEKEKLIKQLNKKRETDKGNAEESIIIEGLEIDTAIKNSIHTNKMQRINATQFEALIAYYQKSMPDFIQALNECGLTDYEIVICILFSIPLSHKQVSSVLCKSPETLSRIKLRLKDKIKNNANEDVLRKIRPVVDLKL